MTPVRSGRRVLGRGLDSLLPVEPTGLREVEVGRIERNPAQPRLRLEWTALEDLAASIREHGVVQPLVVSSVGDDRYRIVVGERRWQAAKMAGLERVPVVVKDVSDRQTLELALVENVQRADLNPLEEATAYQRLIQDFGLTQQQVAQQIGKSRVAVSNTLRLLSLPPFVKEALVEGRITEGHARALLGLPSEADQRALLSRIEREDLSVRQTEALVKRSGEKRASEQNPVKSPDLLNVESELGRALGTRVTVRHGKRGGRIVIEYYSAEELNGLYERLLSL